MTTLDTFLSDWGKNEKSESNPLVNPNARLFNNLLVVLSKSGRDNNTIRINYIKSLKKKSGELKKFLKWVTTQANNGNFALSMAAQPCNGHYEEGVPKEKLKEIAQRYGFEVQYEYPDGLGYEMRRDSKNK